MNPEHDVEPGGVSRRQVLRVGAVVGAGVALSGFTGFLDPAVAGPVVATKKLLASQGYWCGVVNDVEDELTTCAVLAFQKSHGLAPTGQITPDLLRALAARPRVKTFTDIGRVVEVDLAKQVVRVVSKGRPWVILHASTGTGGPATFGGRDIRERTPQGQFRIRRSASGATQTQMGVLQSPHFFLHDHAIHGVANLSGTRGPSTRGGVAVSPEALAMLQSAGHLVRDRAVRIN